MGHAQWVFTIPKILRGCFLRNRELLGALSRTAWETVRAMMAEAAGDLGVRPGMVAVPQTFGNSVNAHPHVHAIASRGVIMKILGHLAKVAAATATEGTGPGPPGPAPALSVN